MVALFNEAEFLAGGEHTGAQLLHIADASGSIQCAVTNYGARLVRCVVPDQKGDATDVALGYRTLTEYRRQPEDYMGAIVGRCANRIAGGHFTIDGTAYHTPQNQGGNTLHGGHTGLHARFWTVAAQTKDSVTLRLLSPDGDDGFPGNLHVEVTYAVAAHSTLSIRYRATTDAPTPVNLSNHAYWNLSGEGHDTITDHVLQLNAPAFTPVNAALIPTGEVKPVAGTPFDFREAQVIGSRIDAPDAQLEHGKGYDHNLVLDAATGAAAVLRSPRSGIALQLMTDAPGMQFYSGNYFDGTRTGKSGSAYGFRTALALEPQAFPDSLHHPGFPDIVLRPGAEYAREDVYVFTNHPE
jgi:aldose 1-epimerase